MNELNASVARGLSWKT